MKKEATLKRKGIKSKVFDKKRGNHKPQGVSDQRAPIKMKAIPQTKN
jgi:hypothetical protein